MTDYHSSFIKPPENTTIWRYMDFTRFVSLLEKRALFFSAMSILRDMDEHEGTYNTATTENNERRLLIHHIGSGLLRAFGKLLAVNCWHINENESVAMWDIYLKGSPGVAIQSTVQNLEKSFNNDALRPLIGKVHYLSENDLIPEPDGFNGLNAVLWKWKSYEYEHELRAVLISRLEHLYKYNGIYVPVDLNQLIQKIIISPKASSWFSELVSSVSAKYELDKKVTSSRLDTSPPDLDKKELSIEFACPLCSVTQETVIEPFIVRDYTNNSTVVFSADRVSIQCQNCGQSLIFPVRTQTEDSVSDSDKPKDATN